MNHTKLSRHQRLAVKPVVFACDAEAQRTSASTATATSPKSCRWRLQPRPCLSRRDVCGKLFEAFDLCALNDRTPNKPAAVKNLLATDHEWIGDWCASVSRALSAAPDSDPQILSRIYTLQVICTEDPKSFRALLLEDAPRKKSLLNAELLSQWIGPDWKAQFAFRSACGHPLIGTELAAVGPDDPRSLTELRNFARQFRYMAKDADDEPLAKAYLAQRPGATLRAWLCWKAKVLIYTRMRRAGSALATSTPTASFIHARANRPSSTLPRCPWRKAWSSRLISKSLPALPPPVSACATKNPAQITRASLLKNLPRH